ncbi:phage GP46 family protein [Herbaspirillum sp. 1130]|uniref:phage GP46 family protein n=1 Tax=Herbaspirillum sp. 1130 TaxID=2806562 RepID=UPI001AE7A45C|nr:phage GP46 family protein [Herbaspirillum sp. 1130]MBP1314270.1 phage gp46-like protein [Herbaspirillum sp. 1130]
MSDIATVFVDFTTGADYALDGVLLQDDDGLVTAVVMSLFTDAEAKVDDVLPDETSTDRRGFWGDLFPTVEGDKIGSRLWLNAAAKQLKSVLRTDERYAAEALQWLVDDGIAEGLEITATNPRMGVRLLEVRITRPDGSTLRLQFQRLWENTYG